MIVDLMWVSAVCIDGKTGVMRTYVRNPHWRGLWRNRVSLLQGTE